jgi:hypothetical protein
MSKAISSRLLFKALHHYDWNHVWAIEFKGSGLICTGLAGFLLSSDLSTWRPECQVPTHKHTLLRITSRLKPIWRTLYTCAIESRCCCLSVEIMAHRKGLLSLDRCTSIMYIRKLRKSRSRSDDDELMDRNKIQTTWCTQLQSSYTLRCLTIR